MRLVYLELVEKIISSVHKVNRNKLYVFMICLCIAVFIWLMIKLSGEYYTNISYPFRFTNIPTEKLMFENADSTINLNLKANGLQLFSAKYLKRHPTVNIDLSSVKMHRCRYRYGSYIITSSLKRSISDQLKFTEDINFISPDSLFFVLESCVTKKVAVETEMSINFKKQYYQYGDIIVTPDSIVLSGLFLMIDTIDFIKTKKIEFSEVKDNKDFNVEIIKPLKSKNIKYSTDKVNIKIPVENYTESSIFLPIQQINDSVNKVKTFPEKVKVTYLVALRDFDRVDEIMFMAGVDCSKISADNQTLELELFRYADFVKITGMFPEKVEYIILK